MALVARKQPFLHVGGFVARKTFVFNGEEFKFGDPFDYEALGCTERKVRTMYNAGFIMRDPEDDLGKLGNKLDKSSQDPKLDAATAAQQKALAKKARKEARRTQKS